MPPEESDAPEILRAVDADAGQYEPMPEPVPPVEWITMRMTKDQARWIAERIRDEESRGCGPPNGYMMWQSLERKIRRRPRRG